MKYPLAAFGFVAIVILGMVMLFTNYNQTASQKLSKVMAKEEIDECYDKTLDSWFIEFNESQENGLTMAEADATASKEALNLHDNCVASR